jgi:hypothetical protein
MELQKTQMDLVIAKNLFTHAVHQNRFVTPTVNAVIWMTAQTSVTEVQVEWTNNSVFASAMV